MKQRRIALLASGAGTNAKKIIEFSHFPESVFEVGLIVTNKKEAGVLKVAESVDITAVVIAFHQWKDEEFVLSVFRKADIDCIVLAGFLLKIPEYILKAYPSKMLNIHPSLLPKYGGKGMFGNHVHEAVLAAGEVKSGITIHIVSQEYDKGPVVFQVSCPILPSDTVESLRMRVQVLEHHYYPKVINEYLRTTA